MPYTHSLSPANDLPPSHHPRQTSSLAYRREQVPTTHLPLSAIPRFLNTETSTGTPQLTLSPSLHLHSPFLDQARHLSIRLRHPLQPKCRSESAKLVSPGPSRPPTCRRLSSSRLQARESSRMCSGPSDPARNAFRAAAPPVSKLAMPVGTQMATPVLFLTLDLPMHRLPVQTSETGKGNNIPRFCFPASRIPTKPVSCVHVSLRSFPPSAASSIRRPSVDRASSTASATADGPPMPMLPAVRLCMHAESERLNETGDTQFWVAVEAEVVAGTSSTANNRRSLLGEVHNLYFTFTTYAACSIETRLDENHNASSLDVGETVSVLVSIKVDASAAASACTTDSDDSKQHQPYLDDAFSQIESLLGVTVVPVLSVECHYKQSSFPPDNEIVVRDTLYMHHQRSRSTPSRFSPSAMASRKEVHQRLAYFIVSTNPSDQALVELDRVFAPPIRACACPAYLEALKQELWRRLDTDRRRSLITSHGRT